MYGNKADFPSGAAGGLGAGESIAFACAGAKLALVDIATAEDRLKQVELQCKDAGAEARSYICDVSQVEESRRTYENIRRDFGHVDVLVNNAGG